jgi:hypothetical protein
MNTNFTKSTVKIESLQGVKLFYIMLYILFNPTNSQFIDVTYMIRANARAKWCKLWRENRIKCRICSKIHLINAPTYSCVSPTKLSNSCLALVAHWFKFCNYQRITCNWRICIIKSIIISNYSYVFPIPLSITHVQLNFLSNK